jgi:dTDP-4-amino-4,6-dideoxygalactose transaminase
MLTTDRDDIADRARRLRSHGMTTLTLDRHKGHAFSYDVVDLGYNYRMGEINAALGLCQLGRLATANQARASLSHHYRERLHGVAGICLPFAHPVGEPAFHIMPVLLPPDSSRVAVMEAMRTARVQTSIHYRPVDTFTAYQEAGLGPGTHLELTHDIGRRVLTLPLYPSMSRAQVDVVCDVLIGAVGGA